MRCLCTLVSPQQSGTTRDARAMPHRRKNCPCVPVNKSGVEVRRGEKEQTSPSRVYPARVGTVGGRWRRDSVGGAARERPSPGYEKGWMGVMKRWGDFPWRTGGEGRQLRSAGWATDGARKGDRGGEGQRLERES